MGFERSTINAAIYRDISVHFLLPSTNRLHEVADCIFQDLVPALTAKGDKTWVNDPCGTRTNWPYCTILLYGGLNIYMCTFSSQHSDF